MEITLESIFVVTQQTLLHLMKENPFRIVSSIPAILNLGLQGKYLVFE